MANVNFQEPYLNGLKKSNLDIRVHITGTEGYIKGKLKSFDQFVLIIEDDDKQYMVYKSSISYIEPVENKRIIES